MLCCSGLARHVPCCSGWACHVLYCGGLARHTLCCRVLCYSGLARHVLCCSGLAASCRAVAAGHATCCAVVAWHATCCALWWLGMPHAVPPCAALYGLARRVLCCSGLNPNPNTNPNPNLGALSPATRGGGVGILGPGSAAPPRAVLWWLGPPRAVL